MITRFCQGVFLSIKLIILEKYKSGKGKMLENKGFIVKNVSIW